MKTTSLLVAVFAGLALAAPSPQAKPAAAAERADVEIEFYTDREYRGDPIIVKDFEEGECKNVPRKANNAVRSIRFRGSERYQCTFYTDRQCRGENTTKRTDENLPTLERDFNKDISSFLCDRRRGGRGGGDRDRGDRDRGDRDRGDRDRGDRDRPGPPNRDGRDGRPQ